jgi:hypothetical protein
VNFVVIATFLGMGVGLLRAERATTLKWIAIPGTVMFMGAVALFSLARISVPNDPNEFVWGIFYDQRNRDIPLIHVVTAMFTLSAIFFVPLGSLLGAQFRKLPPLQAYAADISGSLAGIAVFGALSAMRKPPVIWLLAYNVFGAIVGGVLEYSSMALGIKALYVIAALTYCVVAVMVRGEERRLALGRARSRPLEITSR